MNKTEISAGLVPKLALNRIETAQAISQSPATVDIQILMAVGKLTPLGILPRMHRSGSPLSK